MLSYLQFSLSKYSPTPHDLSNSHSQLLGLKTNPLPINSLNSHLHLSLFQRCLLLETLASYLNLHF